MKSFLFVIWRVCCHGLRRPNLFGKHALHTETEKDTDTARTHARTHTFALNRFHRILIASSNTNQYTWFMHRSCTNNAHRVTQTCVHLLTFIVFYFDWKCVWFLLLPLTLILVSGSFDSVPFNSIPFRFICLQTEQTTCESNIYCARDRKGKREKNSNEPKKNKIVEQNVEIHLNHAINLSKQRKSLSKCLKLFK